MQERINYTMLGLASAVAYGVSGVPHLWPLGMAWPLMLWVAVYHIRLTWLGVFVWATLALGCQLSGLMEGLFFLSEGAFGTKCLMMGIMLFYQVSVCSAWLMFTESVVVWWRLRAHPLLFFSAWAATTWAYLIVLNDGSLIVCGSWEGCGICSPLAPLTEIPALLWPLPYVGEYVFLGLFLGLQALIASGLRRWCGLSTIMLWLAGAVWHAASQNPSVLHEVQSYVPRLGIVRSQFFEKNREKALAHIRDHLDDMERQCPHSDVIMLPESSVYSTGIFPLVPKEQVDCHWCFKGTVVIGGLRSVESGTYNTVWLIKQGKVVDYFDKQHALPITERIPWWGHYCGMKAMFFSAFDELIICDTVHKRPQWELFPGLVAVPYICSEFFLAHAPRDRSSLPILALCNSAWVPRRTRWLMARTAALKALAWQRMVIYVAHDYSALFTPDGRCYPLYEERNPCVGLPGAL